MRAHPCRAIAADAKAQSSRETALAHGASYSTSMLLVTLSLVVNVVVLAPVIGSLALDAPWVSTAYGPRSGARGIVLAMYIAIFVASAALLARPVPSSVSALLFVQVVYKLLSPVTLGTLRNPVVLSNLAIAALHSVTLTAMRVSL